MGGKGVSGGHSSRLDELRGDRLEKIQERIEAVRDAFVPRLSREEDGHEKVVTLNGKACTDSKIGCPPVPLYLRADC